MGGFSHFSRSARDYSGGPPHCNRMGGASALARGQQQGPGVERLDPVADLEMELRPVDIAALAGKADHLAAIDAVSHRNDNGLRVRISRDVAVVVADED